MKKVALFDLDNTVYNGFSVIGLIESEILHGFFSFTEVIDLVDNMQKYRSGKLDYETAMTNGLNQWAKGLAGKRYTDVLDHAKKYYTKHKKSFFPYVSKLIPKIKKTHDIYFITGEPQFVGESLLTIFNVNGFYSSVMEEKNGIFTGEVINALSNNNGKKKAVSELLKNYDTKGSIAFGDSEGDIAMLEMVEHPICINSSKKLKEIGLVKKWLMVTPENIEKNVTNLLTI